MFCASFSDLSLDDIPRVGGKNASLGELIRALAPRGVRIPPGFAVTADAYTEILSRSGTAQKLKELLAGLDPADVDDLSRRAAKARALVRSAGMPWEVESEIRKFYRQLSKDAGVVDLDVAVRSSATAEDLPDASFAGQQETFLNVHGEEAVLEACLNCFASLFTARAIAYRTANGYDHLSVRLSVGIQQMVRSDLGTAGVIFTLDPESGFRDVVLISGAWGLGEAVVSGQVDPDEVMVFKGSLGKSPRPIIRRRIGSKQIRIVYAGHGTRSTRTIPVPADDRERLCITDEDALILAQWAVTIEEHYSARHGRSTPMDLEWAKDGRTNQLFIVQARPETVQSQHKAGQVERWLLKEEGKLLLSGRAVGESIGAGLVRVVRKPSELGAFQEGDVLVAEMTDPDWVPVMKKASAIVTNGGGRTCHAAIVSRELGVPCVVGTGTATKLLSDGMKVTVSCAEGNEGKIYEGILAIERQAVESLDLAKPRTKVMVNLADPDRAFTVSQLPVDGVGLAREEFIIAHELGVHPMALMQPEKVDPATTLEIQKRSRGYNTPADWFVGKLAEGIGTIAAAFYPRPVIVRFSDFKTNEYAGLLGGAAFEPKEENPMIGFRGASRYADPRYRAGFSLECRAMKEVWEGMGLTNLRGMVPFCRTAAEGQRVREVIREEGLTELPVWVMCEIPSNVLCIDLFAEVFDGFSIGSNDLTQLTLGVDRDSSTLSAAFDERDEAVHRILALAIQGAQKAGRPIGICGQAPSDYPEIARFLVEQGIHSVSLNPDAVHRTIPVLLAAEATKAL